MCSVNKVVLVKMCRFHFLPYVNRVTVRTFGKEVYILKSNLMVKNMETDEIKRLEDIYYDIRTVRNISGNIIAKRTNRRKELYFNSTKARAKAKVI